MVDLEALRVLEGVPEGWRVLSLRRFADVRRGTADKTVAEGERLAHLVQYTDVYYKSEQRPDEDYLTISVTENEWHSARIKAGDLLVTGSSETIDDIGHSTYVSEGLSDHVFGSDVIRVRPEPGVLAPRYGKYIMENIVYLQVFTQLSRGVTRFRFSMDDFKNVRYAVPSMQVQQATTNYLDSETARIDALIDRKQCFIDLLLEKRVALIAHAVTRGLDPMAEMMDSNVEWLGAIPGHWEAIRIKSVAALRSGHTPDKKVAAYWEGGTIPWVSLADSGFIRSHRYVDKTSYCTTPEGIAHSSAVILPARAVILSRDATVGLCAITTMRAAVSQHFMAWICGDKIVDEYLLYVLETMQQEFKRLSMGSTIPTIGLPHIKALSVPLPPLSEQHDIVHFLATMTARLDTLVSATRRSIDLLREYRTALISAAVTGQIDIPAASPSEEVA